MRVLKNSLLPFWIWVPAMAQGNSVLPHNPKRLFLQGDQKMKNSPFKNVECNGVLSKPTYMLAALQLIKKARDFYSVSSENWPYPFMSFGHYEDPYYAEIWVDGMDYQHSYWLLEALVFEVPEIIPFIIFNSHTEEDKFNLFDKEELFKALLWKRRNSILFSKVPEKFLGYLVDGRFFDTILPYLKIGEKRNIDKPAAIFKNASFEHASQPKVEFWVNEELTSNRKLL